MHECCRAKNCLLLYVKQMNNRIQMQKYVGGNIPEIVLIFHTIDVMILPPTYKYTQNPCKNATSWDTQADVYTGYF